MISHLARNMHAPTWKGLCNFDGLREGEMKERRRYPRYDVVTRVDVRLPCSDVWIPALRGNTVDVSREGVAITLYEGDDKTNLVQTLLARDQAVEVALELPFTGERIRGKGTVRWLDVGPAASGRHLRAGIFLSKMEDYDRTRWGTFVEDKAVNAFMTPDLS